MPETSHKKNRSCIERFNSWIKTRFRRIVLRYEIPESCFRGLLDIASFLIYWKKLRAGGVLKWARYDHPQDRSRTRIQGNPQDHDPASCHHRRVRQRDLGVIFNKYKYQKLASTGRAGGDPIRGLPDRINGDGRRRPAFLGPPSSDFMTFS